jgi:hypothetical protein
VSSELQDVVSHFLFHSFVSYVAVYLPFDRMIFFLWFLNTLVGSGVRGGVVVEALRYKPEGHWIFSLT